jgi:hypothetical protein
MRMQYTCTTCQKLVIAKHSIATSKRRYRSQKDTPTSFDIGLPSLPHSRYQATIPFHGIKASSGNDGSYEIEK